jgi:hypothetical protein
MIVSRRTFIRATTAAGVALAAPSIHAESSVRKRYRTALISSDWWDKVIRE